MRKYFDGAGWWPHSGLVHANRVAMEPACCAWYFRGALTNLPVPKLIYLRWAEFKRNSEITTSSLKRNTRAILLTILKFTGYFKFVVIKNLLKINCNSDKTASKIQWSIKVHFLTVKREGRFYPKCCPCLFCFVLFFFFSQSINEVAVAVHLS